jgi:phage terminase large subunit GpA-like protein
MMNMKMSNKEKLQEVLKKIQSVIKPPTKQKPSEFAESQLRWCDGPFAGELMKLHPYQIEPLNQTINPKVRRIVLCSAAQMLKTSLMTASICYFMVNDPANAAYASNTATETHNYSSGKLQQTIDRSGLQEYLTDKNDKTKPNNQDRWMMASSDLLYFLNLNSPSTLRSKTLKRVYLDECSNVDVDSSEGNPIDVAATRTSQFQDGLVMLSSTPKIDDDLIVQEYKLSNQCKYFIRCPHCEHEHEILFDNVHYEWKEIEGGRRKIPDENTARLLCPECSTEISEAQRIRAVKKGRWIATVPEITDVVGYNISRLYSPIESIKSITKAYSDAFTKFSMMAFKNNYLGQPFSDEISKDLDLILLENLRDSSFDVKNIPDDVLAIVMGIDQQLDRLECTTIGFSEHKVYVLDHRSFYSPDCTKYGAKAYTELNQYVNGAFLTVSGRKLKVLEAFIDAGNGNASAAIYRFCSGKKLFTPIKGSSSGTKMNGESTDLFKPSRTGGRELMLLNVNDGKTTLRRLLNGAVSEEAEELPLQLKFTEDLPDDYFVQMQSEHLKRKGDSFYWILKKGEKRNESLDCLNYALIAMSYSLSRIGKHPFAELRKYNARLEKDKYSEQEQPTKPQGRQPPQRRGNNWFGNKGT